MNAGGTALHEGQLEDRDAASAMRSAVMSLSKRRFLLPAGEE
jgi:hypothetical protein